MNNLFSRWKESLTRSSKAAFGQLASILGTSEITEETWDDLEALLLQADLGLETTSSVLDSLKRITRTEGLVRANELSATLRQELRARLSTPPALSLNDKPSVVLVVGVNGSGKTTTIAKLSSRFTAEGRKLLLGAADTFRAAAVDQLQVWGDRLKVEVIAGAFESDPGAVAFNAVQAGVARGVDIILIDTAGRLHTRFNLMEELKKVNRVVGKALPGAPHQVWLVLDATTGQNALQQARSFKEAVQVSGVILSKLDSSARGGMAFAIQRELGLPILFAGLGEKPEDLQPFDPDAFVDGILSNA
ncbi:MAG TPA: signal recognition particle-docking protein FtsY [Anaerolineales bacterium]|nr:signal recognition particle-docking protein FtsY [Anaerolineales bacterium]HNE69063.1 signal recognition particle-docking protein FtsY [Anaerolineales bacterium]HNH05519.1 signal recognition particle-docking protein FtsY [Anaerolineales bacterium]HNJ13707.1 signal recognition particle-docking protein FtsY [Anaerolineales bacterium]HUM25623.1 signal recognition particle-docking protein FtsY [Anaerolineales bacterium]